MLTITENAAKQILESARQTESEGMALRVAAKRQDDGTFEYALGFDNKGEHDTEFVSNGINVLVSDFSKDLVKGATLDYVELNPGSHEFIFINPNDPSHTPLQ
jgi:iron-sulfur cluster assembly protein